MSSETEAIHVRDCLHGRWINGSRIRVNFVERDSRNQFWRRKRRDYKSTSVPQDNGEKGRPSSLAGGVDGLSADHRVLCRVEGSVIEDSLLVLQHCSIGWCQNPISNSSLAEEMSLEKVLGVHVMRLVGSRVLLIFDSIEGSVIVLEETTVESSSFERGRVLVETSVLDRIEECLELSVDGHVFPIRLTESDTLLRGPRVYRMSDIRSSSEEVASRGAEDLCPQELEEGQFIATES
ncbi:hypothetical protein V6N13_127113 [Hibiscus sabdariffa]